MTLTHFNDKGYAKMVSVDEKDETQRVATAQAFISMSPETFSRIQSGGIKKGDVLATAQVAGIMGAKKTSDVIPMCHPLLLTGVDIDFHMHEDSHQIEILATVKTFGRTGVEMEALTGASICALTIYDMCKAMDKGMTIEKVCLMEKIGGKSGHYLRGKK